MEKIIKQWRRTIIFGALILALALVLRLYNLTLLPIFGDEAIYIRWSQVMGAEPGLRFLPLSDGKQPLFMWVLMFLVRRFSDPLFIGRLTSVVYGMGTLVGIFTLTYYLFKDRRLALIASLFWAISPYFVFFDRMALVDAMLTMFGVWTILFGVITARTLRLDTAMLTGFALGGALLTKSPGIFFVVLLPVTWVVSNWPKRRKKQWIGKKELIHSIKLGSLSLVSVSISLIMYNILRLGENFHLIASRNQDYVYPLKHIIENPLDPFLANFKNILDWVWTLGPSLIIIFALIFILSFIKREYLTFKKRIPASVALLFLLFVVPRLITAMYAKTFTARYILFTLPYNYIFASLVFSYLFPKRELLKKALAFGLFVYASTALFIDYRLLTEPEKAPLPRVMRSGYLEEWTAGTGIYEISAQIREEYLRNPQQKIIVGTEGYFGTLPDGLQAYLNDLPEITVIGTGLDFKEVPESLVESKKAGNKTYFVVNSTRLLADPEELGLELAAVYPKAFRPDGSRESLYLFEVTEKALID